MTIVIKRYSNRKLYDTSTRCYIALDEIAKRIRQGNTVQIIDNVTEEDITNLTLMQVILSQEKKQAGFLPRSILLGLIQAGENLWSELGIPTQEDLEKLKTQLNILEEKIDALGKENS